MKKVVASLVLASLVSSSASAVDVLGAVRSSASNMGELVAKNPKTVLSAAGMLVVGSALAAYKYDGRARAAYKTLDPRGWFGSSNEAPVDSENPVEENTEEENPVEENTEKTAEQTEKTAEQTE